MTRLVTGIRPAVAVLAVVVGTVCAGLPAPNVSVELKKAEDSVAVTATRQATVVAIQSKSGIGAATLRRTDGAWPAQLKVRLDLKGLESFRMDNGVMHCGTSHKSPERVPYWKAGKPDTGAAEPDGTLSVVISRTENAFEIVVPREFLADNPQTIRIAWIDFFRN